MKVAHVIGARPQFIKYYPVSKALGEACGSGGLKEILVHTGQHYDYVMSKVFFDEFGIREPDYHLGVGSGSHGSQTARVIEGVEGVLSKEGPDAVLLYGDTNSTLGGAIAASKLHLRVLHVEAGLRSFNKHMPEEINRILADNVSSVLFCPSEKAVENLRAEGFGNVINGGLLVPSDFAEAIRADADAPVVINVGDVMQDAVYHSLQIVASRPPVCTALGLTARDYIVMTLHRAENTDKIENFEEIVEFSNVASAGKTVVFPMHPRTQKAYELSKERFAGNVRVIGPLGYFDMIGLVRDSLFVMTDSGGLQKEACWLQVPCVTLRGETEWVETIGVGCNVLYRDFKGLPPRGEFSTDIYGDGKAAVRIALVLKNLL